MLVVNLTEMNAKFSAELCSMWLLLSNCR